MFLTIFGFVLLIFVLVLPGWVLRKTNLVKSEAVGGFANALLYVCSPMLVFKALLYDSTKDFNPTDRNILFVILWTVGFTLIIHITAFLIAKLVFLKSKNRETAQVYNYAAVFGNVGFLGIPFVEYLMPGNTVALICCTFVNVVFNILMWTLGVFILTGDVKKIRPIKILLNPIVLTLPFALPLLFCRVDLRLVLPPFGGVISDVIRFLGNMAAPLSMMIVGMRLADTPIKSLFTDLSAYVCSALKLLIMPLAALGILLIFKAAGAFGAADGVFWLEYGGTMCAVIAAMVSMPVGANTIAFCVRFDKDYQAGVKSVMNCTLLSLATLPLLLPLLFILLG